MKLFYGWVIVGAGALMGCVAIGSMFSLAVFLQPMSDATGWSRTGISTAMATAGSRLATRSGARVAGRAASWPSPRDSQPDPTPPACTATRSYFVSPLRLPCVAVIRGRSVQRQVSIPSH